MFYLKHNKYFLINKTQNNNNKKKTNVYTIINFFDYFNIKIVHYSISYRMNDITY